MTRIWAIADTHLSFHKPKDMAKFGGKWVDHEATIALHWRTQIAEGDVVLLPGDISWAQSPNRVWPDLNWLRALPGRKVLLRGNHDHWWKDIDKVRKIVEPMGFYALEGDCILLDGVVIAGAMGHVAPHDPYFHPDPPKDRYQRELARLEQALVSSAEARTAEVGEAEERLPLILIMHYPPFTSDGQRTAYVDLISRFQPTLCLYGHLHHQREWEVACQGEFEGVQYALVAADYLGMKPKLVWPVASYSEMGR
jgi:hypothetical protein